MPYVSYLLIFNKHTVFNQFNSFDCFLVICRVIKLAKTPFFANIVSPKNHLSIVKKLCIFQPVTAPTVYLSGVVQVKLV